MTVEFDRLGIWNWERPDIRDEIEYARYAEEQGLDSVWQGESRLARDAISVLGAYTQVTETIDLAPGVVNCYTRNVALMAQTFSTLDELSGGRVKLGLGAWWDPLAEKVGIDRESPLRYMWEYCTVARRLLDSERVSYEGEFLSVDDIELDLVRADGTSSSVPIYVGATGPVMHEMTGELVGLGVCDGVFMNYLIRPEHNETTVDKLREGVERQGGDLRDVDRPQLVAVSIDEDVDRAIDEARGLVAQYIGMGPVMEGPSGMSEEGVRDVTEALGGWPADAEDIERAKRYVPDEVVKDIVAVGTPRDCVERVHAYCERGCTEPVLYSINPSKVKEVIDVFAEYRTG